MEMTAEEVEALKESVYIQTAQLTKLRIAHTVLESALSGDRGRADIVKALQAIQRQITRLERESGVYS